MALKALGYFNSKKEVSWKHFCSRVSLILFFGLSTQNLFAANIGFTYQGRILNPDGTPVTASAVELNLQITGPQGGASTCVMYAEKHTVDLSTTKGVFNVVIGRGQRTDASTFALEKIFSSNLIYPNLTQCSGGYVKQVGDAINLNVAFNDGKGLQTLPAIEINQVPSSMDTLAVAGIPSQQVLRVDNAVGASPVSNNNYSLNIDNFAALVDLINGISTKYAKTSPSITGNTLILGGTVSNQQQITLVAPYNNFASYTLALPTSRGTNGQVLTSDGTGGTFWSTASSGGSGSGSGNFSATITTPTSGQFVKYNGTNWINAAISAATDLTGALPIANGGTGATTATAARTSLGLGTAATLDTGSISGKIPVIGATGITNNSMCTSDGSGAIICNTAIPTGGSSQWTTSGNNISYTTGNVSIGNGNGDGGTGSANLNVSGIVMGGVSGQGYPFTVLNASYKAPTTVKPGYISGWYLEAAQAILGPSTVISNTQATFNSGNVGIGTQNPTSLLHSSDSAAKTANYTGVLHNVTNTSTTNSINKIGMDIESTGTWTGTSATNTGLVVNATGGTTNYAATFSGGNVGIGTTTPGSPLTVNGVIQSTSGGFKFPDGTTQTTAASGGGGSSVTQSSIQTALGGPTASVLTMNTLGQLGINLASVTGATFSSWLNVGSSGGNGANISLIGGSTSNNWMMSSNCSNCGTSNGFSISLMNITTGNITSTPFSITNGGNVGIGTTRPAATLDVNGTIKAAAVSNSSTTINFATGNLQYTSSSCGAFTLNNMVSGTTYVLAVQGTAGGTCSFSASGFTIKAGSTSLTQTAGNHTIFTFLVMGTYIYVASIDGY